MKRAPACPAHGFSYVEAMVAMILIVTCLVPALQALQTSAMAATVLTSTAPANLALRARMEAVVARPYAVLDFAANRAASSATVPVSSPRLTANPGLDPGPGYSDASYLVYIYRFDGSALTTADSGLLRVRVVDASNPAFLLDALVAR